MTKPCIHKLALHHGLTLGAEGVESIMLFHLIPVTYYLS